MLAVAQEVSRREGLTIDYRCASAGELPFESGSFDAALCLQGLQYLPDPLQALGELRRVLVPADAWPDFLAEVAAMLTPWKTAGYLAFPTESHVLEARGQRRRSLSTPACREARR